MSALWYYRFGGHELGPLPFETLAEMANSGELGREDEVREDDAGDWLPAGSVPGLFSDLEIARDLSDLNFTFDDGATRTAGRVSTPPVSESEEVAQLHQGRPEAPSVVEDDAKRGERKEESGERRAESGDPSSSHEPSTIDPGPLPTHQAVAPAAEPARPLQRPVSSDRWFCRIEGIEHGPLTFENIRNMSRHGRLKRSHEIKQGDDGEWIDAATVPELFSEIPAEAPPAPPSVGPAKTIAKTTAKEKRRRERVPREPLLPKLLAHKWALLIGTAVVAAAGIAVVVALRTVGLSDEECYQKLQSVLDEHRALRKQQAGDAEWDALAARAESLKEQIVPQLTQTASADRPAQLELLWAANDYMLPMLKDCRTRRGPPERRFEQHLKTARKLLDDPSSVPRDRIIEDDEFPVDEGAASKSAAPRAKAK